MKKLVLFILCALTSMSAFAQNSAEIIEYNSQNATSTIIREVAYPSTITCQNTDENSVLFVYADASLTTKEFLLTYNNLVVHDMSVLRKDTVVFCGDAFVNGALRGVVGYFKISDMLAGSVTVKIQNNFITGSDCYTVRTLKRMTSYSSTNGIRHIVCVGSCVGETDSTIYPCIVNVNGFDFFPGGYESGYINNTQETFEDIALVESPMGISYIVTAGFDLAYGRYMCFRIYNSDNIFSAVNNIQDTLRLLRVDPSSVRKWLDEGLSLSRTARGGFATTSFRHNNSNTNYRDANIHIGTYLVDDVLRGRYSIMDNSMEIPLLQTGGRHMKDLLYSSKAEYLVFLHESTSLSTGITGSYYCEMPEGSLPVATSFNVLNIPDIEMHSLSLYNTMLKYIWSGFERATPHKSAQGMDTYGFTLPCANKTIYNPTHYDVLSITKRHSAFDFIYGIYVYSTKGNGVEGNAIQIKCIN